MKLILTQDVPGLGAPGDVVEVKDGYGRNYLMPRGFAIAWTRGGEKQVTQIKRARKVREVRDLGHANEIKQALEALTITMPAHAGETGRLFGSITNADVADALQAAGHVVERRRIEVPEHIKQLGSYDVSVKYYGGVTATIKVWVVRA